MKGWKVLGFSSQKRLQAQRELDRIHDFTGTIDVLTHRQAMIAVEEEKARSEEQAYGEELSGLQKRFAALPEVSPDTNREEKRDRLYKNRSELLGRIALKDIQKAEISVHERDSLVSLWREQSNQKQLKKEKSKGREL